MSGKRPSDVDLLVGERLRHRRVALGISQTSLAGGLGITFQQVQKYERGINRISASRLQAAADILSVPVMHFFVQDGSVPGGSGGDLLPPTIASSKEAVELTRHFMRIRDRALRDAVVAMLEAAASAASGEGAIGRQGRGSAAAPLAAPVGER